MLKGKGFEDTKSYYKHCEMFFMEIESRQKVRESQKKLIALCSRFAEICVLFLIFTALEALIINGYLS